MGIWCNQGVVPGHSTSCAVEKKTELLNMANNTNTGQRTDRVSDDMNDLRLALDACNTYIARLSLEIA